MTIWRMYNACWIPKAINTSSAYVIFTAFPLQQRVHKRVSVLRHTYTAACLVSERKWNGNRRSEIDFLK